MNQPTTQPDRILRMPDVTRQLGICRSTVYQKLDAKGRHFDPDFPRPVKLGASSVGWLSSEIEQWIKNLSKATNQQQPSK